MQNILGQKWKWAIPFYYLQFRDRLYPPQFLGGKIGELNSPPVRKAREPESGGFHSPGGKNNEHTITQ